MQKVQVYFKQQIIKELTNICWMKNEKAEWLKDCSEGSSLAFMDDR